jgi:hypothetical protein
MRLAEVGYQDPGSNMVGSESRKKSSMANSELKAIRSIDVMAEVVSGLFCLAECGLAAID